MARKNSNQKKGKSVKKNQNQKSGSISRRDVKKTKFRVEKLNEGGLPPSELFKITSKSEAAGVTNAGLRSLQGKKLQEDMEKDHKIQEKMRTEREEMANKLMRQIEGISGFSL